MPNEIRINSEARYHGAPGKWCCGAMKYAKVSENNPGPISMPTPRSDARAPCSSPCSKGDTCSVISDCDVEPANDQ